MRDLNQSGRIHAAGTPPKGLAFDIPDLLRARAWAVVHDRRMRVLLDHSVEGEEYEEVIEFLTGLRARSKTILWRNEQWVFVQPLPGRRQRYRSMREALNGLLTGQRAIAVSDIVATTWPAD